ncbi:MAG: PEP-CTERM sorting domain-containing protein [Betaproteobacteria bacterium]|nr:PEP-CTERM sorting domain-containing protein [Betaproteobacteria bacterium]
MRFNSLITVAVALVAMAVSHISAHAVTIDWVTVGNPGNANDIATERYGKVNYSYQIAKYDVTIQQYTDFLNAVAKSDPYSLYNTQMANNRTIAGIERTGSSGSYNYNVKTDMGGSTGNKPITYVSWFDAARFANWMHNGQLSGTAGQASTEIGAYTLNGATSGTAPAKNSGATFYIPTENEWYKAAYYSPDLNFGTGGYYAYATRSDSAPGNTISDGGNQANYYDANNGYSMPGSDVEWFDSRFDDFLAGLNYLTDVGAFTNSKSFYGTFDQSGNVFQWNDLDGSAGLYRGLRGGAWDKNDTFLNSYWSQSDSPSNEYRNTGFRLASLASPAAVPEPSTWAMGLAGIACAGWGTYRRRRAR